MFHCRCVCLVLAVQQGFPVDCLLRLSARYSFKELTGIEACSEGLILTLAPPIDSVII